MRVTPLGGKEHVCSYRSYSMSSYFQGLPKDARDRYEQKLILSGLSLEEHPYIHATGTASGALTLLGGHG